MAMTLKEREELYVKQFNAVDTQIKQLEEELEALKAGREQIRGKVILLKELMNEQQEKPLPEQPEPITPKGE